MRKIATNTHAIPDFIDFDSPEGQTLLQKMHARALALANARVKRLQKQQTGS